VENTTEAAARAMRRCSGVQRAWLRCACDCAGWGGRCSGGVSVWGYHLAFSSTCTDTPAATCSNAQSGRGPQQLPRGTRGLRPNPLPPIPQGCWVALTEDGLERFEAPDEAKANHEGGVPLQVGLQSTTAATRAEPLKPTQNRGFRKQPWPARLCSTGRAVQARGQCRQGGSGAPTGAIKALQHSNTVRLQKLQTLAKKLLSAAAHLEAVPAADSILVTGEGVWGPGGSGPGGQRLRARTCSASQHRHV
jgi:hypothetical protein